MGGRDDGNVLHPGDVAKQTELAMENVKRVLAGFGAGLADVVKLNRFYVGGGTRGWEVGARVAASYFEDPEPAATGIPVPALAHEGLMVEIEVIAIVE